MPGADEQDVAGRHGDALAALGRLQILAEHVLSRFDPRDAPRSGHVEQDAAADKAVLEDVDRSARAPSALTDASGLPSKNDPSKATWLKASMCVCPSLW